jgi:hypothetical protein
MKPKKEIVTLKDGTNIEYTPMVLEQPKQEPPKLKWILLYNGEIFNTLEDALKFQKNSY